jgi:hypothetical protein
MRLMVTDRLVVKVHLAAGCCTKNRHLQLLGLLVDDGRWQQHQLRRLGLHGCAVVVGSITQTSNVSAWLEKDRVARYMANGGQQAREKGKKSMHVRLTRDGWALAQTVEQVVGEVEAGYDCGSGFTSNVSCNCGLMER